MSPFVPTIACLAEYPFSFELHRKPSLHGGRNKKPTGSKWRLCRKPNEHTHTFTHKLSIFQSQPDVAGIRNTKKRQTSLVLTARWGQCELEINIVPLEMYSAMLLREVHVLRRRRVVRATRARQHKMRRSQYMEDMGSTLLA